MSFVASVPRWLLPWSPVSLIRKVFRSGRHFSAWIGLVPKQSSSGGKQKFGSISKQGDRYLRSLFTAGALAALSVHQITMETISLHLATNADVRTLKGEKPSGLPIQFPIKFALVINLKNSNDVWPHRAAVA